MQTEKSLHEELEELWQRVRTQLKYSRKLRDKLRAALPRTDLRFLKESDLPAPKTTDPAPNCSSCPDNCCRTPNLAPLKLDDVARLKDAGLDWATAPPDLVAALRRHPEAHHLAETAWAVSALAEVLVDLPGGPLKILWDAETGKVFMTGPAEKAFEGVLSL